MNEKTAKLLRKYAKATEADLNQLKRQWNDMNQFERRDFRVQLVAELGSQVAEASTDEAEEAAEA